MCDRPSNVRWRIRWLGTQYAAGHHDSVLREASPEIEHQRIDAAFRWRERGIADLRNDDNGTLLLTTK